MDPFEGILVQVISNGQILESYDDPDASDNEDPYQRQQYIEAVASATFAVKMIITDQFNLYDMSPKDGIVVNLSVDGLDWGHRRFIARQKIEKNFPSGEPFTHIFDKFTHFSNRTGQWMKSEYSFNALRLNKSTSSNIRPAQVQHIGKIEISFQRVRWTSYGRRREQMKPIKSIMEVSERALKGKAVENTVRPTEGVPAKAPECRRSITSELISGSRGKPLVHKILYRSKRHLQMIGCIPPEPSSPVITILDDEGQDSASGDLQQQVQSLRAQVALLERTLNVKSEHPRNIKREREDDENTAPRQRRRISARVKTIDLTDD